MAAERMKFAKSLRDCELWCRKERGKRIKLLLATSKPPVIDKWSPYYKRMSIYGQFEDLKQKHPTAEAMVQQEVSNISLSMYEILCKFLDGLHDIQEFARSAVAECKSFCIVDKSFYKEGHKEPNQFYSSQQPCLEEAEEFINSQVSAYFDMVEAASVKHRSNAFHIQMLRKKNKRAKVCKNEDATEVAINIVSDNDNDQI